MARITVHSSGALQVPSNPIIPYIEGDGVGPDIWAAARPVLDGAVAKAYGRERAIDWLEVLAGEKAFERTGEWLPEKTLETLRSHVVAIKGPLTTPIGEGMRSLNVALRRILDLYACIRPIQYIPGVPSPMKNPEKVDMVVFRENTEDVYAGLEWAAGEEETRRLIDFLRDEMGVKISSQAGIGIKPMTEAGSKRLVRKAIQYALDTGRKSVTLVHKGNIMKYTEGAFRTWGYEAAQEFGNATVTEAKVGDYYSGQPPSDRIVIKDRIAD
ncbi:MAG: NADP-dependent isocitrate dehydrogenase, partial [Deltaproteobacteria bacterium]|nr:NADP-dependent isocitrate dehydrogenase [Deltaproteobacteria bacterium]